VNEPSDARVRFLRQLFDDAPAIVVLTRGPKHVYEYLNKAATTSSGARPDIIGKTLREGRPELAEQGYGELYDGVYRTGKSFVGNDARVVRTTADGSRDERVLRFSLTPWRDEDGKVSGVLLHAVDVTDEVAARDLQRELLERTEQLRAEADSERRRLDQLLDVIPVGMVIYDRDGKVVRGNQARARIIGDPSRNPDVATSVAYLRPTHEDGRPWGMDELPANRALRGETVRGALLYIKTLDGVEKVVLTSAAPLHDATGAIDGAVQFYQELDPPG
jgi:PAS domain S-box-containing protein